MIKVLATQWILTFVCLKLFNKCKNNIYLPIVFINITPFGDRDYYSNWVDYRPFNFTRNYDNKINITSNLEAKACLDN